MAQKRLNNGEFAEARFLLDADGNSNLGGAATVQKRLNSGEFAEGLVLVDSDGNVVTPGGASSDRPTVAVFGDSTFGQALQATNACQALIYLGGGLAQMFFAGSVSLVTGDEISVQGCNKAQFETIKTRILAHAGGTFTGSITDTTMAVTAVAFASRVGAGITVTGAGVTAGTKVVRQLTGTTGGIGTYEVSASQTVPAATALSANYGYTYQIGDPAVPPGPAGDVDFNGTQTAFLRYATRGGAAGPTAWAEWVLGDQMKFVNVSQVGDTTAKLLGRFDLDVKPVKPHRVLLTASVNDAWRTYDATTTPAVAIAEYSANLEAIYTKVKGIGAQLDLMSGFPQLNTRAGWSAEGAQAFAGMRKVMRDLARRERLLFLEWGACSAGSVQVQNSTSVDGVPNAGMTHSDNVHPQNSACSIAGLGRGSIAEAYAGIYGLKIQPPSVRNVIDAGIYLLAGFKGNFTGSGGTVAVGNTGTVTGTIPDGVQAGLTIGTGTLALTTRARTVAVDGDDNGFWLVATLTPAAAGDRAIIRLPDLKPYVAAGDLLRLVQQVNLLNGPNCKDLGFSFTVQSANVGNLTVSMCSAGTSQQAPFAGDIKGTPTMYVPVRGPYNGFDPGAPSNVLYPTLAFTAVAAGAPVVVEIACAGADKVVSV